MSLTSLKPSEIDLLVKKEWLSGYETYQMMGNMFFNIETPQRFNEKESVATSDGDILKVAEGAEYPESIVREIGSVSYTSEEYKRKIGITELMVDFSNYNSTMKEMRMLGYRARYKQDTLMRDVLTGGFDNTVTWDGEYLFSASHQISDTGKTQSNLLTGALSLDKIIEGRALLRTIKGHDELVMPLNSAYLIHPVALAEEAFQYTSSPDDPTTANRAKNFANTLRMKTYEWAILDEVSETNYFLVSEKMFHSLTAFQKVQPNLRMYIDEDTGNMYEKVRFVQTQGATDYPGVVGSTGTA